MPDKLKKTLIGALISIALAAAVSYGLITQDTADKVQTKADQALTEGTSPAPQNAPGQSPDPNASASQKPDNSAPAPNTPPQNPAPRQ